MKTLISLFAVLCLFHPISISAQSGPAQDFLNSVKSAIQEKSSEKLDTLTYTVGMSDSDKQVMDFGRKAAFSDNPIEDISFGPIPPNTPSGGIMAGRKYEMTFPAAGMVIVKFGGSTQSSMSLGYAIIGGKYFLVSAKSTDLGWKGPPDKSLIYNFSCRPEDKIQVVVDYNVSGVDQQQTFTAPSGGVMGQYFKKVTVTSLDDNINGKLTVTEGGTDIFTSQPLKGKGTVVYKKG
jgi:hypothetical protein